MIILQSCIAQEIGEQSEPALGHMCFQLHMDSVTALEHCHASGGAVMSAHPSRGP